MERKLDTIEQKFDILMEIVNSQDVSNRIRSQIGEIKEEDKGENSKLCGGINRIYGDIKLQSDQDKRRNIVIDRLDLFDDSEEETIKNIKAVVDIFEVEVKFTTEIYKWNTMLDKNGTLSVHNSDKIVIEKREIFRNSNKLKKLNSNVSACDDLNFSERNLHKNFLKNKRIINSESNKARQQGEDIEKSINLQ